jgi:hypothetical protein
MKMTVRFGHAKDIVNRTSGGIFVAALILFTRAASGGNFYAGTSPSTVAWTSGIVPYEFTNTLTAAMQQTYLDGLREWELAANVKFVPHTNQSRWILFTYNTNYFDNVSTGYSPQVVSVDNLSRAQVGHEMGHSFGFTHENIRTDQTNYLTILSNNVTPGNLVWFQIDTTSVTNGGYDFESVMHLARDFASTQPGVLDTQLARPAYARYQPRMGNLCLSPGDRAALRFLYGPPAVPITNLVTITADAGPGSLRAAMYYVADHPGSAVKFNIPTSDPGYSNGVFNIHLTGHLPPLAVDSMVIDGSTQPGFNNQPIIFVDGSQILPDPRNANTGLLIYSANNQVKNISFQGFNWNGLTLRYADATNNTIAGCWLGLDATGTNTAPNAYQGILIEDESNRNIIGGTNALARNVISGNSQYGILISGTNTAGNLVLGNYVGTDAGGTVALGNLSSGVGIDHAARNNTVGGQGAGAGNVLSGNAGYGVLINHPGTTGNVVQVNLIGTSRTGSNAVPNLASGVLIYGGAQSNTIGGATASTRNVISGHPTAGVYLIDAGTAGNVIQGNFIGTDISGTTAIGNNIAGIYVLDGAQDNSIGGAATGAGNVISGNNGYGLFLGNPATTGNLIQGNFIGTRADGSNSLANGYVGIYVFGGAQSNVFGLKLDGSGAGNRIAFNNSAGVFLGDPGTTGNTIRGNSIYNNLGLGLDLSAPADVYPGVTANDPNDADTGPNNLQNFPVFTSASASAGTTLLSGTFNSQPNRAFILDFYRNTSADPSGYGEGQIYAGSATVTTDTGGNAQFGFGLSGNFINQYFTATATDLTTGDTSEFSLARLATAGAAAPFLSGPFILSSTGFTFNLTALETGRLYHVQASTNLVSWSNLANVMPGATNLIYTDSSGTNFRRRFYRAVSP